MCYANKRSSRNDNIVINVVLDYFWTLFFLHGLTTVTPYWIEDYGNDSLCSLLVFRHLADHVVEDASVVEIR